MSQEYLFALLNVDDFFTRENSIKAIYKVQVWFITYTDNLQDMSAETDNKSISDGGQSPNSEAIGDVQTITK